MYRGDFALGTLMRFLPIVTQIFLWFAVFQARGSKPLAGYSYEDFVAYYLLTMVARAFSSMPGLASRHRGPDSQRRDQEVPRSSRSICSAFCCWAAWPTSWPITRWPSLPFALVFFLCRDFFPGWPSLTTLAAGILSLVLCFLLGYFLEACMGLVGFWWLEVSSLLFVYMLFSFFLSGHMFPLDMLPQPWQTLVELTPLQYLAYFPAAVLLGKIQGWALVRGLAHRSRLGRCSSSCSRESCFTMARGDTARMEASPCRPRASYLASSSRSPSNSLVRNMMFRVNFLIECVSQRHLDDDEPGLLPADLSVHRLRSAPAPAGASGSFSRSWRRRCSSTASCRRSSCRTARTSAS